MSLNVKVEAFEGPFDLLFHLIEKNEIDIYDIPIAELTDQYLSYLKDMGQEQLDIASEFLVMAAVLVNIKSQMLLPPRQDEQLKLELAAEEEELDPRAELVRKLVQYKKYKMIAKILSDKEKKQSKLYKTPSQDFSHLYDEDFSFPDITLEELESIFLNLINKKTEKPKVHVVNKDPIPLTLKIKEVYFVIKYNHGKVLFSKLNKTSNLEELVVTFLAILELVKLNKITANQNYIFGEIVIYQREVS